MIYTSVLKTSELFMQGIVTNINGHRVLPKLKGAGIVGNASVDIWLCVFLIGGSSQASDIPCGPILALWQYLS